jgi:ubiquinone/menaquinone biosynthesis C-methylase UbiE
MGSKRYFDKVAIEWDTMRKAFFSEIVREKAMSIAEVRSGKLATDIGAGTGFVTEGLTERSQGHRCRSVRGNDPSNEE